jgi:alanyl-tRNA synthetase
MVAEDRLRFDFSQPVALTPEDIAAIEAEVNAEIRANETVGTRLMTPDDAVAAGALALFGEKYGDEVRVLSMGRASREGRTYSVELCGGTHVRATGDIGVFRIVSESAVSSGVRRIEALTGEAARAWLVAREDALKAAAGVIRATPEEVPARLAALMDERKRLEKELAEAKKALALGGGGTGGAAAAAAADETVAGVAFSGQVLEGLDPKELRPLLDAAKQRMGSGIAAVIAVNDGKASIAAAVTDDLTARFSAVDLVRAGVEALGGKGGGGRPDMAQGGGPDGSRAADALAAVKAVLAAVPAA